MKRIIGLFIVLRWLIHCSINDQKHTLPSTQLDDIEIQWSEPLSKKRIFKSLWTFTTCELFNWTLRPSLIMPQTGIGFGEKMNVAMSQQKKCKGGITEVSLRYLTLMMFARTWVQTKRCACTWGKSTRKNSQTLCPSSSSKNSFQSTQR